MQTIDNAVKPEKTYDDYLAEARKILAEKNNVAPKPYEYYLAQATADIANAPRLKQEAEKVNARNSELHNQGKVTSSKTWVEYLAEAKMILAETNRPGSELNLITTQEKFIYDIYQNTDLLMGEIMPPQMEQALQNRRLNAIKNMHR